MKSLIAAAIAALFLASTAEPSQSFETWNRACANLAKNWQAKPRHKAIAIGGDSSGEACGLAWARPTQKAAEQAAIQSCKRYTEGASCHVVRSE